MTRRRNTRLGVPGPRVVLDTSAFRGASSAQLRALRERGLHISVWVGAVQEVLASLDRDGPDVLFRSIAKVAPFIDERMPLAPYIGDVTRMLRGSNHRGRKWFNRHLAALSNRWFGLVEGFYNRKLPRIGRGIGEHLDGNDWSMRLESPVLREAARDRDFDLLYARSLSHFRIRNRRVRIYYDAFWRVQSFRVAMHSRHPGSRRRPEQNDNEDLYLLASVALPAFVAVEEKILRRDVRESGSYQAPWVLSMQELVEMDLPGCMPWGMKVRRAAEGFQRALRERYGNRFV